VVRWDVMGMANGWKQKGRAIGGRPDAIRDRDFLYDNV
jgi:hypothetical protein